MSKRHPLCNHVDHQFSRRQILGGLTGAVGMGAFGAGALGGLDVLASPVAGEAMRKNEKQVIFIWLDGGISQLESWDPKPNTQFGGPFRAIPTSVPGIHVSELVKHSAKQMHHLSILRSLHTQDNSHSAGVARINRGDPKDRGVVYPYLGSAVAHLLGPTSSGLPPYVWVKPYSGGFKADDAGFLGAKFGALALGDAKAPENLLRHPSISVEENQLRNQIRQQINARYVQRRRGAATDASSHVFDVAEKLMAQEEVFDESKIPARDVQRYGTHELGRHLLMARRLIEAGVRFVKVNSYHWDSHGDNFNASQSLIPQFDQPFAALIEDLSERQMLDDVLVIAMSEFGRTPKINSHVGRDHWPEAWSVVMAGCGLQRGAVVGQTDPLGTSVASEEYDIGHLFHTWFRALGVPAEKMEYNNDGQPLPVAHDECFPIKELLT